MKSAYVSFLMIAIVCGCSAESSDPQPKQVVTPSNNELGPSDGDKGGLPCPPPLVFTVIRDGKEVQVVYDLPCAAPEPKTSLATDPPGWEVNGNSNHDQLPGFTGTLPVSPIIDPVPRKL